MSADVFEENVRRREQIKWMNLNVRIMKTDAVTVMDS